MTYYTAYTPVPVFGPLVPHYGPLLVPPPEPSMGTGAASMLLVQVPAPQPMHQAPPPQIQPMYMQPPAENSYYQAASEIQPMYMQPPAEKSYAKPPRAAASVPRPAPAPLRPYSIGSPGSVPAPLQQEYSQKLVDILSKNPPATYAEFELAEMGQVDQTLFLGSYRHAENGPELVRLGFTHVLNCARPSCPNHDANFYLPYNMAVQSVDAMDSPDFPLLQYTFDTAYDFLADCDRTRGTKCLIHCFQGLNRSASICVAYLMIKHRAPLVKVVERVHAARCFILGNAGFRQQLIEFAYANHLLQEPQGVPAHVKSPKRLLYRKVAIADPEVQPYEAGPTGAAPRELKEEPAKKEAPAAPANPAAPPNANLSGRFQREKGRMGQRMSMLAQRFSTSRANTPPPTA